MHICIKILNKINEFCQLCDIDGTYHDKVSFLKNLNGPVNGLEEKREEIISLINELNPKKLKLNLFKIKNPNIPENEISNEMIDSIKIEDFSTIELLRYFATICYGVTYTQSGKYILMKYGAGVFVTGWSELTLHSRGIVIDYENQCIASYPFDKFFNVNETDGWRDYEIVDAIKHSTNIVATDKKDGSLIAVTNYQGDLLITTNGSFSNMQVSWAKILLEKNYYDFYSNIPEGYTFIFELIYPLNRTNLVIDYGDTEKLYLLDVRDLGTNRFMQYSQLQEIANKYHLDLTEAEPFESLYDLIRKANNLTNANKEGWVLNISLPNRDVFVKIKLAEYFILHKAASGINIKKLYNIYSSGNIQDLLKQSPSEVAENITSMIEEIDINRNAYVELVLNELHHALRVLAMTREEVLSDGNKLKEFIAVYGCGDLLAALKGRDKLERNVMYASWKNYQKILNKLEVNS